MNVCVVACLGALSVLLPISWADDSTGKLFQCLDGTPTWDPCAFNGSITNAQACANIPCDSSSRAGMVCANFHCGPNMACQSPLCTFDAYYQPPRPSPYVCPDNKTQAITCSSGVLSRDPAFVDKCTALGCNTQFTDSRVCGNFMCGENAPCSVMCLADPKFKPLTCPDGQTQAHLCNIGNGLTTYAPQCASLGCPVDAYGQSKVEGVVCREVVCGDNNASCKAMCLNDPYYNPVARVIPLPE